MARIVLLALVALVLLLGTQARGQTVEAKQVERLIEELGDPDKDVRQKAAWRLGRLGPKAAPAVPALIAALSDKGRYVRRSAVEALEGIGAPAVPALIRTLSDEKRVARELAARALAGVGATAVPALVGALADTKSDRVQAAKALEDIGPDAAPAVPALIAALSDEDKWVRHFATRALGGIGTKAASAVPALIAILSSPDQDDGARDAAASALGKIGVQAAPAIPALTAALSGGKTWDLRCSAASALGQMGPQAAPAVPALIGALSAEEHWMVRDRAVETLIAIGPEAVPALIVAYSDDHWEVREAANKALDGIGSEAVPPLIAALSDDNVEMRTNASVILGGFGSKATPAVPALIDALSDESQLPLVDGSSISVGAVAADALKELGTSLKAQGSVLWWVVPRAYWKEIAGCLLFLTVWFTAAARFPRQRGPTRLRRLVVLAVTAAVPAALCSSAVHYAITRDWAEGFLPDTLTLVPLPVAAVLSVTLVSALPAVWVCQRKPNSDPSSAPA